MVQNTTPVSAPNSNPWAPSMPNSDLFTLVSSTVVRIDTSLISAVQKSAKDAARFMSPKERGTGLIPRRIVAVRTCPLVMYQSAPPASMAPAVSSSAPASQPPAIVQSNTTSLQGTRGRAPIGLGHPSSSKRSAAPVQPAVPVPAAAAEPTAQPPAPRARINSSTIKRRTERFPRRELHTIAEDAECTQTSTPRPVPGTRKRSYAQAVAETETDETHKNRTSRRVTPTPAPTTPTSAPTTPGSPRCAAKQHPSGAFASIVALAPRSTSSGAPQAGPTQVQSPRVLFPARIAGSPCFQSLDGAVQSITQALGERAQKERVAQRFMARSANPTNVTVAASPFRMLFLF
ncbi:hypothetical protein C8R47DRAFT_1206461 [Mycena vitilis]|nr:hypothetical protein C8R47DRAFT_1206461 [Mycena vitilis]